MICLFAFLFSGLFLSANGKQTYNLIPVHGNISYINPEYVEIPNWSFRKYNKTVAAFNFDFIFKQDLDDSFTVHVIAFLFKNNEFKKTAVDFEFKVCKLFNKKLDFLHVGDVLWNSNLTLECPIKKGTYYAHDIIPDAQNGLPSMPPGKWLIKQEFKLHGIHITTIDFVWIIEYS